MPNLTGGPNIAVLGFTPSAGTLLVTPRASFITGATPTSVTYSLNTSNNTWMNYNSVTLVWSAGLPLPTGDCVFDESLVTGGVTKSRVMELTVAADTAYSLIEAQVKAKVDGGLPRDVAQNMVDLAAVAALVAASATPPTPAGHAASHAAGGSDAVTLTTAQITGLDTSLAAKASTASLNAAVAPLASTASVTSSIAAAIAPLATTASVTANTTNIAANTSALALKAPLASPTFTGPVNAPTPTTGDNSTLVATTAFVTGQKGAAGGLAALDAQGFSAAVMASARVYSSVNQSIANATGTVLTFDSKRWDTDTIWSAGANTRLTAQHAGLYMIGVGVSWALNATGARQIWINLNGVTTIAHVAGTSTASTTSRQVLTTMFRLAAGDYLQVYVWQDSGGALSAAIEDQSSLEFWALRLTP